MIDIPTRGPSSVIGPASKLAPGLHLFPYERQLTRHEVSHLGALRIVPTFTFQEKSYVVRLDVARDVPGPRICSPRLSFACASFRHFCASCNN